MPYLDAFRFSRGQLPAPATNDRIIQDSDVCAVVYRGYTLWHD